MSWSFLGKGGRGALTRTDPKNNNLNWDRPQKNYLNFLGLAKDLVVQIGYDIETVDHFMSFSPDSSEDEQLQ